MSTGIIAEQSLLQQSTGSPAVMTGVRFDNTATSTGLYVTSQTVTDSPQLTVSMFVRAVDFTGNSVAVLSIDATDTLHLLVGMAEEDDVAIQYFHGGTDYFTRRSDPGIFPLITWHHWFMSTDMDFSAGAKICNILIDGTAISTDFLDFSTAAFDWKLNAHRFGIPTDQPQLGPGSVDRIIDYQSVWIGFGQYVDPADVDLFRDPTTHLPMDLGIDGSGPTGVAPTYYFQGDASEFVTNKGSGPTVTLIGTPTDV